MAVALARPSKDRFVRLSTQFSTRFVDDSILSRAASLAYYTTLAIAPFTVILLICLALLGQDVVGTYTTEVRRFLGDQAGSIFVTAVSSSKDRPDLGTVAGIVSVLTLLISSSAVFAELRESLNLIYHQRPSSTTAAGWKETVLDFLRVRILNAGLVLGFIFLLITSLILSSVISAFSDVLPSRFAILVNYLGSGAAYVVTFTLLSRFVPSKHLKWEDAFRGGLITAFFFLVGKELISSYLGSSNAGTAYGAAGSLVIFLLWVYYSATILFACAVMNDLVIQDGKEHPRRRRSGAPTWKERIQSFKMRPAFMVLGAIIAGLVVARAWLPGFIRDRLNAALASNEKSIGGYVEDVDLAIYRGAYRLEGVHLFLIEKDRRLPAASAKAIDISVAWRELFRGRVRADVDLESPRVLLEPMGRFVRHLTQGEAREEPKKVTKSLVPFAVDRVRAWNGRVDSNLLGEGDIKPLLKNVVARATDIYDSNVTGGLTSRLEVKGRVADGGEIAVSGSFHRPAKDEPARWEGKARLESLPLPSLNALLLDLVPLSFTDGRVTAEATVEANGKDLDGEAKTTFEKVDVISTAESWKGPKHAIFELGSALGFVLTKSAKDQATVASFGFERKNGKFSLEYREAIESAIKHGFSKSN